MRWLVVFAITLAVGFAVSPWAALGFFVLYVFGYKIESMQDRIDELESDARANRRDEFPSEPELLLDLGKPSDPEPEVKAEPSPPPPPPDVPRQDQVPGFVLLACVAFAALIAWLVT